MGSFRFRTTCWFAAALFVLTFLVLLSFTVYTIDQLRHSEKVDLKLIARSIEKQLAKWPGAPGEVPAEIFRHIDEGVVFADAAGELAYAVYSRNGTLLHRSADFNDSLRDFHFRRDQPYRLFWGMKSTEAWHFVLGYNAPDHIVLVSNWRHVELVEEILVTFGICSLVVLGLSVFFGILMGGRVTQPIRDIGAALERVRKGDLAARIEDAGGNDEIAQLKGTLNMTFAKLEDAFNRISQFSSDAAHELKTPLTALRGNLEVCLNRERSVQEYQETIVGSIEDIVGLNAIIDDLLLLSRAGEDYQADAFICLDWSQLLHDVVQSMMVLADEKQVILEAEPAAEVMVWGIETFLRRLVINLLQNAIKYTASGGRIRVRLTEVEEEAVLTVQDEGIGIDPVHQAKVFERFYQVDASRNRGAGLGLAMVKWIVVLHHGTVEVESEVGQGATFTVRLPQGLVSPKGRKNGEGAAK